MAFALEATGRCPLMTRAAAASHLTARGVPGPTALLLLGKVPLPPMKWRGAAWSARPWRGLHCVAQRCFAWQCTAHCCMRLLGATPGSGKDSVMSRSMYAAALMRWPNHTFLYDWRGVVGLAWSVAHYTRGTVPPPASCPQW